MKLEFFLQDTFEKSVILLYSGTPNEVMLLRQAFRSLAESVTQVVAVHELPFVESIAECALTAVAIDSDRGIGISQGWGPLIFTWALRPGS